jgi:hypothetical protein
MALYDPFAKKFSAVEALSISVGAGMALQGFWLIGIAIVVIAAVAQAIAEDRAEQSA